MTPIVHTIAAELATTEARAESLRAQLRLVQATGEGTPLYVSAGVPVTDEAIERMAAQEMAA